MRVVPPLLAALLLALLLPSAAGAATAEEQLAQRYAPEVRLVEQTQSCGKGEPYVPTNVEALFGNDEVALRGPWSGANLVKVGPRASDLLSGRFEYALDFPGDALNPGCIYEQWSQRINAGRFPTVYAHVVGDPAHPGRLALQYWFFYVYNDFNNKHEGDWEMIQLNFFARDAADALRGRPSEIGYSQHEGGERAHWGSSKLEVVGGTHPVVYPAAGSHANFFRSALFLGRSAAQGVGCDDTENATKVLHPHVLDIPSDGRAERSESPWLGYLGRWGERQPSFYNGPTGPNLKTQWTEPITWADDTWRDDAFAVPSASHFGPSATGLFCDAVAAGSNVLTRAVANPLPVVAALLGIVALLLWIGSRTSWARSAPFRLARRRRWGELITASWELYWENKALLVAIGVLFVPLSIVITLVQYLLFQLVALAPLTDSVGGSNAFVAGPAFLLGLLFTVAGLSLVQSAVAAAMRELDEGRAATAREAYRLALIRLGPLLRGLLWAVLVAVLLDLTVIGIPVAVWLVVRWSLLAQVVQLEGERGFPALHRSARLVQGHWLRVATITVVTTGLALALGPVVGVLLLLVTTASFNFVNLVAGVIYMVTLPFAAVATTYLYYDLRTRQALEAAEEPALDVVPAEI